MGAPEFIMLIVGIALLLIVFLAIRSIMPWYWKVDKGLLNQEAHLNLLEKQNRLIEQQTQLIQEFKNQMGNNPSDPNRLMQ